MERTDDVGLCSEHYKGTASEYMVAALFLKRGYQVYWPAVQQSCVDLVVFKNGVFSRIQVKTASWNKNHLQCRVRPTNKYGNKDYDFLFIVSDVGFWEIPIDEISSSNICLASKTANYRPKGKDWSIFKYTEGV